MTKSIGIMQPYFLPYMGYWQLIAQVDEFVIYDNIQYTKKGWITRNRFLRNGEDTLFSLSLKADSDFLEVRQRVLAETFDRKKLLRQFQEAYRKAPGFAENFPLIEEIVQFQDNNLSVYLINSIKKISEYLGIRTPLTISSTIAIDHCSLKGADKVKAICLGLGADRYLNPIGGLELYDRKDFSESGIDLCFLRSQPLDYLQFGKPAIPHLSILDVLMFNSRSRTQDYLSAFTLE